MPQYATRERVEEAFERLERPGGESDLRLVRGCATKNARFAGGSTSPDDLFSQARLDLFDGTERWDLADPFAKAVNKVIVKIAGKTRKLTKSEIALGNPEESDAPSEGGDRPRVYVPPGVLAYRPDPVARIAAREFFEKLPEEWTRGVRAEADFGEVGASVSLSRAERSGIDAQIRRQAEEQLFGRVRRRGERSFVCVICNKRWRRLAADPPLERGQVPGHSPSEARRCREIFTKLIAEADRKRPRMRGRGRPRDPENDPLMRKAVEKDARMLTMFLECRRDAGKGIRRVEADEPPERRGDWAYSRLGVKDFLRPWFAHLPAASHNAFALWAERRGQAIREEMAERHPQIEIPDALLAELIKADWVNCIGLIDYWESIGIRHSGIQDIRRLRGRGRHAKTERRKKIVSATTRNDSKT